VHYEGEQFTPQMIERAGKERLAPMLMTALTAGIALIPLVLAAGEPGKEILYPVATVILGGLISSTLLDFFVHPALFWCFGRQQAEQRLHDMDEGDDLEEDSDLRTSRSQIAMNGEERSDMSLRGGRVAGPRG
jgi:HME family heavy-metal exporter